MKAKESKVLQLAKGILAAPDDALVCARISPQLPTVVDAQIAGEDVAGKFPKVTAHLELCAECRREYEELLEITRVAEGELWIEAEQVPQFDLQQLRQRAEQKAPAAVHESILAQFRRYVKSLRQGTLDPGMDALGDIVREGISGIALLVAPVQPTLQLEPVRAPLALETRQVVYLLKALGMKVTLKMREFEHHRFTVRGLVEGDQEFEGLSVCLLSPDGEEPLDCTMVDETNTFAFHSVSAGHYSIRLDVTSQESIHLTGVEV